MDYQLELTKEFLQNNRDAWRVYSDLTKTFIDIVKSNPENEEIRKSCLENIKLCKEILDRVSK